MKLLEMYPHLKSGCERIAAIEFTWAEVGALSELLASTIQDSKAGDKIILNFEKSITTGSPYISCYYNNPENE